MREKRDIRLHIRKQFKNTGTEMLQQKSDRVLNHLFQWNVWQESKVIAITMSTKNEIDTRPIIKKGWEEGKKVAIPKVNPSFHSLEFYVISSFEQTKEDFAGIMEPIPEKTTFIPKKDFDLIIVPGLAFDLKKFRIGFGGGYYDRMLADLNVPACGLALDFQLYDSLPREPHDIPLTAVITEMSIVL